MTKEEENVLEANQSFYSAFQNLSLPEMEAIWLREDWVRCLHPGWELLEGWEAVRQSWQQVFENTHFMRIVIGIQFLRVENSWAWVCCTEKISSASRGQFESAHVQSTNLFKRQNGRWYIVHHHASLRPSSATAAESVELVQ